MNIQLLDSPRFVHEAGSLGWACRYGLRVQRPALVLEHRGWSLLIGESCERSGDSYAPPIEYKIIFFDYAPSTASPILFGNITMRALKSKTIAGVLFLLTIGSTEEPKANGKEIFVCTPKKVRETRSYLYDDPLRTISCTQEPNTPDCTQDILTKESLRTTESTYYTEFYQNRIEENIIRKVSSSSTLRISRISGEYEYNYILEWDDADTWVAGTILGNCELKEHDMKF